jgi:hypothetical protein
MKCGIALILLSCGLVAFAEDTVDAAVKRLSTVERFAFGGVGYAGVISKGEIDFKFVFSQPHTTALAAFEELYAKGNPQGKAYALSGIKRLDSKRFKELLTSAGASKDQVVVMRGCIVSHESLQDIAWQIDEGKFRF